MIRTILRVNWLTLTRDRVALGLTFALPLVFFTIFASVFGGLDPGGLRPVAVTLVAGDSGFAAAVAARLEEQPRLEAVRLPPSALGEALGAVRRGRTSAVVVLPASLTPLGGGEGEA
ncbi:MAG: hypothetical protein AAF725_22155, partial [Acidobacteriota bacterium]